MLGLELVLVGQAVGIVGTGANPNLGGGAHEVLVVGAFGALTGANRGQDLRQTAVNSGVDKRGTLRVVGKASNGDSCCTAMRMVVERTICDGALGDGDRNGHDALPKVGSHAEFEPLLSPPYARNRETN